MLCLVLAASACTHERTRARSPEPSPSSIQRSHEPYEPTPILGRMGPQSVDFPMPHMSLLSGWGSMQRGVNMWVVSGTATLEQADSHSIAVGEVCSIAATFEDSTPVRDLIHCHWDQANLGTYTVTGQTGTVAALRRSDGRHFTYEMKTGALTPTP